MHPDQIEGVVRNVLAELRPLVPPGWRSMAELAVVQFARSNPARAELALRRVYEVLDGGLR